MSFGREQNEDYPEFFVLPSSGMAKHLERQCYPKVCRKRILRDVKEMGRLRLLGILECEMSGKIGLECL
jgi:hypothetical protein